MDGFTVSLSPSAKIRLNVDLADEELTRYGIVNTASTPFLLPAGVTELPLEIDVSGVPAYPQREFTVGVLTVSDSVTNVWDSAVLTTKKLRGYRSTPVKIHDDDNALTTYAARYERVGIVITVF